MVIVSALACELCSQVAIPPPSILKGLGERLSPSIRKCFLQLSKTCWSNAALASVQDACLLAMLRVAAECDEVPAEIVRNVTSLAEISGRHIRQVCYSASVPDL